MTDFSRRFHLEVLAQVTSDYARENERGRVEVEQDMDLTPKVYGPVDHTLAASASATEVTKPVGATTIRWLVISGVTISSGVNVRIDGSTNDPTLVKPPDDNNTEGVLVLLTSATTVHIDNPSSTSAVSCTIAMGCV